MKLTPTERRLFRESVIREYKEKHETQKKKNNHFHQLSKRLKKIIPINILVGVLACVALVYIKGWDTLFYLLLSGVIWITLISTIITAFLKNN